MASPATFRQDLPPEGGYKPINFQRVPAKEYFNGKRLFAALVAVHYISFAIYRYNKKRATRYKVENRSGDFALLPMLRAQKDRAYLKVLRKNRDEEEKLMANVPGWEVGTYYGDKIYHTRPADEWHDVILQEYFAHVYDWWGYRYATWWKFW